MSELRKEIAALYPQMLRFACSLTRNRPDAEDLLQGALEKALTREAQYIAGTSLKSWLYRIIQTQFLDRCRTASAEGRCIHAHRQCAQQSQAPTQFDWMLIDEIGEKLREISPAAREAFIGIKIIGESRAVLAKGLDISDITIATRAMRVQAYLGKKFE